ncbi:MAG: NfeD family protein, partial [Desulfurococcaceae archaeon]
IAVELYTPGFGVFGVAGVFLTAVGLILAASAQPREALAQPVVLATVVGLSMLTGLVVFIAYKAAEAARIKRKPLSEALVGSIGIAKTEIGENAPGVVYVAGEEWSAFSTRGTIPQGSRVRVVKVEGLKLYVEKAEEA